MAVGLGVVQDLRAGLVDRGDQGLRGEKFHQDQVDQDDVAVGLGVVQDLRAGQVDRGDQGLLGEKFHQDQVDRDGVAVGLGVARDRQGGGYLVIVQINLDLVGSLSKRGSWQYS